MPLGEIHQVPRPVEDNAAVCVWDVNDPTRTTSPQLVLRGHAGRVLALAALDGGRLASAGDDRVIRIWNVAGGILEAVTPVATLEGHRERVRCLAALDDAQLASGSWDKSVMAISALPMKHRFKDAGDYDLVVRDLTGQDDAFVLLDYALNLSPALRDSITRDVAQNVSEFEPRLKREPRSLLRRSTADPYDASLREGSVQPKADYLLQPPRTRE